MQLLVVSLCALSAFRPDPLGFSATAGSMHARALETGQVVVTHGADALRFQTHGVPLAVGVDATGALRIDRAGHQEQWHPTLSGFEQRWRFERAPGGPLVIALDVQPAPRHCSPLGFWAGPVHYGAPTWVDANGRRTAARLECDGRTVRLRVDDAVVAASAFPAVLDPMLTSDYSLDDSTTLTTAIGYQRPLAIAHGAGTSLVLWTSSPDFAHDDLFATRLDAQGLPLDRPALQLTHHDHAGITSTVFLNGVFHLAFDNNVEVVQTLQVDLGGHSTAAHTVAPSSVAPALATDGTGLVAAWASALTRELTVSRINPADDTPFSSVTFQTSGLSKPGQVQLSWDGATFLVVWSYSNGTDLDLEGRRFRINGGGGGVITFLDAPFSIAADPGNQHFPSVVAAGNRWLVSWVDGQVDDQLVARYVDDDGTLQPTAAVRSLARYPDQPLALVPFGSAAALVYSGTTPTDSRLAVIEGTSIPSTDGGDAVLPPGEYPLLTQTDAGFITASAAGPWLRADKGPSVFAVALSPTGQVGPFGAKVSGWSLPAQLEGTLGTDGDAFLVLWSEFHDATEYDVRAARLSRDSGVLDPSGFDLLGGPGSQRAPTLVWAQGRYLAAWRDQPSFTIRASFLTPRGKLAGAPFDLGPTDYSEVALATDGTDFVAAWASNNEIFTRRVLSDGGLETTQKLNSGTGDCEHARIAFGGGSYLVVWQETGNGNDDVRAASLTREGLATPPFPVADGAPQQIAPFVAFDGTYFVVAWTRDEYEVWSNRIAGTSRKDGAAGVMRVPNDGVPNPVAVISLEPQPGGVWLVTQSQNFYGRDISGRHLGPTGAGAPSVLARSFENKGPGAAAVNAHAIAQVYSLYEPDAGSAQRVKAHLVHLTPVGGSCTGTWECDEGDCIANVCKPRVLPMNDGGTGGGSGAGGGSAGAGGGSTGTGGAGGAGGAGGGSAGGGSAGGSALAGQYTAGCGCTGAPGWGALLLSLAALARRSTRRLF